MSKSIHFFAEDIGYTLPEKNNTRLWISYVTIAENSRTGEICFVFCSDKYLSKINHKYLKNNTLTDIITFPTSEEKDLISGDIFISLPRVKDNAKKFKQKFIDELHRVMIHGVLHLIGYSDTSKEERKQMRLKEDFYLDRLFQIKAHSSKI